MKRSQIDGGGSTGPQPKSWAELNIDVNMSGPTEQDAICPKCSPTRKKSKARPLGVNLSTGLFYCHHCGRKGSQLTGWDDETDWRPPSGVGPKPKEYQAPKPLPERSADQKAADWWLNWWKDRGISVATLKRNQVKVVSQWMRDANDGEGDTLWATAFPYLVDGEHVNTKFRGYDANGERCNQMAPGCRLVPYGLDDVPVNTKLAFWVEGEPDKLAMEEGGFRAVLSVPNGAPALDARAYESHFQYLHDFADRFATVGEWVIAVDADGPGRKLGTELARTLGPQKCWYVDWSLAGEGIKDANDALLLWGKERFQVNLRKLMRRWPVDGLFHVETFAKKLDDWYDNGPPKALSTGWELVDPAYKLIGQSITILTGVPNIGKSTFLNALMVNQMMANDWRFAICSPEWRPIEDHIRSLVQVIVGKPFSKWMPDAMSKGEYEWARDWVNERIAFILPETPTIPSILGLCDTAIARLGVKGLIIDPWGEIETSHMKPNGMSETDWIGQQLRDLRRYTIQRDLWTCVSHHPAKMEKGSDGEYPVIDIYDLRGSAKFADIADFVVSLWRSSLWDDQSEGEVEVWIKKARYRYAGRRGASVKLWFDENTGRFSDRQGVDTSPSIAPWETASVPALGA
jgi:twinkle protein